VSGVRYDKELEQFRNLMKVPSTFEDGFSWSALAGAVFIALLMVPGAMYMNLLAGIGVGPAAQWVTVILFIEVARRAHKTLKRPEIFVLFYMAGAAMGQPFQGLLFNQFYVQSQAAVGSGVAEHMADVWWFAPVDTEILSQRNFFQWEWMPAIGMVLFTVIMGRLNTTVLTYGLFRLASDVEKLPFPMAPIGAQGIMALSEQQAEESGQADPEAKDNWRWRVFSIGGVLGLSFGALYMALPAISSAMLNQPISIFPIPFVDWTQKTSEHLPAVATGLSLNIGQLITGMVLPFFAMLGSFIGLIITVVANPIMYSVGMLPNWESTHDTVTTLYSNTIDFYFSFSIGVAIAIALAGVWQVLKSIRAKRKLRRRQQEMHIEVEQDRGIPEGRGDIKVTMIIGTYLFTSAAYIIVSGFLIHWHPGVMMVLLFFAFLYTPIMSYVTARLEGLAGQVVEIPFVREAAFILSGYTGGVKVWFLPVPIANYGKRTVFYRQAELTGTKFWSLWKAELLLVPIVVLSSILFAQFIWSLNEIPGPEYPYADMMWELEAARRSIVQTSTMGRFSQFQETFNWEYLFAGAGFGVVLFAVMYVMHMPIMLTYGVVRGLNQTMPHVVLPQFIGAMIGRYYFQKRLGLMWRQYIPVVMAGFACGMGLITVLSVGVNFLAKAVIKIPF
jgi:hypothetical protein